MRSLIVLAIFLFVSTSVLADVEIDWTRYHAQCESGFKKGKVLLLEYNNVYLGVTSLTEISINARNKDICFKGAVPTNLSEDGNSTIVGFESGGIICQQKSNVNRLAASELTNAGVRIIGKFIQISGQSIILQECKFQKI